MLKNIMDIVTVVVGVVCPLFAWANISRIDADNSDPREAWLG
jgi:hypothetical protein